MSLMQISSPHTHGPMSTAKVMAWVLAALLPGTVAMLYFFGIGVLINLLLASATALACEAMVLRLRRRPLMFYLSDGSALVTAALLALALPAYCPWWVVVIGSGFAIVIAKQLYGGLGYNLFNPAMVAYVVLLIAFPVQMTAWPTPAGLEGASVPGVAEALKEVFTHSEGIDGYTSATPLDLLRHNEGLMLSQVYQDNALFTQGKLAGFGFDIINAAFLLGGLVLLARGIFSWHTPVAMLASLGLMAALFYDGGSSTSGGSALFHWFSGATMLGAFFIATDPVTSATSKTGRLIFGAGIGVLVFCIRHWGNYPDAVAFAVLLMNFAAPFIDYYTLPRTYGHERRRRATEKED